MPSSTDSQVIKYFKDWNNFLSPRSDGYGDVDDPKIDIGVDIVANLKSKFTFLNCDYNMNLSKNYIKN